MERLYLKGLRDRLGSKSAHSAISAYMSLVEPMSASYFADAAR